MLSQSRHATIAVFTGAILPLASLAALAQKPALTQNIDEKGRIPITPAPRHSVPVPNVY